MSQPPPVPLSFRWFSLLAAIFALLCAPLLLSTHETNYTWDETSYHLPAIRQIREHWPRLDVRSDSLSATVPGYHYVLAGVSFLTGAQRRPLRLVNFAISLGVLGLLWRAWPASTPPASGLVALLPLAASNFFVKSASYIVTDNAALLAVTGALLALFMVPGGAGAARAGSLAGVAVLIRQSGIWLVAPLAVHLLRTPRRGWAWLWMAPPLVALLWLVSSWRGLVPPAWQEKHYAATGLAPAAGAYMLAVLALLGTVYYAAARPAGWRSDLCSRGTALGALAGLAIALSGANTPDYVAGRWGGYLWDLAARLPTGSSYSPLFLVLAPAGGALLGMLVRRLWMEIGPGTAVTWSAAYLAWAGSGLSNRQVFHRYFEPVTLVLLICWLTLIMRARPLSSPLATRPLVALGVAQLALTLITAHGRTFGFF